MRAQIGYIVHVIDDDEAVRESLEALLLASGFETVTYDSAEDFLARAPSHIGCLLLDIHMPGMSGLDLIQHLAEQGRRTSVVFLTANPDKRLKKRALELGAGAYLTKPVKKDDLLRAIADTGCGE